MSTDNVTGQLYAQVRENPFGGVQTPTNSSPQPIRENPFGGSQDQVEVSPSPSTEIPRNNPFGAAPTSTSSASPLVNGETITFLGGFADGDEITVDDEKKVILLKSSDGKIKTLPFQSIDSTDSDDLIITMEINNEAFYLIQTQNNNNWNISTTNYNVIENIQTLGLGSNGELLINGKTLEAISTEQQNQSTPQEESTLVSFSGEQLLMSGRNTFLKLGTSFALTTLGGLGAGALLGLLGLTSLPFLATAAIVGTGLGLGAIVANLLGQTVIDGRNLSEVNLWEAGVDGAIATFTGGLGKYFTLASNLGRSVPRLVSAFAGKGSWLSRIFANASLDVGAGGIVRATDGDNQTRALDVNAIALDVASSVVLGETANLVSRFSGPRVNIPDEPTPPVRLETRNIRIFTKEQIQSLSDDVLRNDHGLSPQQINFIRSSSNIQSYSFTGEGGVIVTTSDSNTRSLDSNGELQIMNGYTPSESDPPRIDQPSQRLVNVRLSDIADEQLRGLNLTDDQVQTIQSYRNVQTDVQRNLIVGDRVLLTGGDYVIEIQPDGRTTNSQNPFTGAPPPPPPPRVET